MASQIRLVVFDLDGTLLDSRHQVSSATLKAVETLTTQGVRIVLATGRRFGNVAGIARQYGLGDLIIVHNGALVRQCGSGEVVYFQELDRLVCADILDCSRRLEQSPFVHVDPVETRIFFERQKPENRARREFLARNESNSVPVADLAEAFSAGPVIEMMFTHSIASLERCKGALREQFRGRATVLETSYPDRDHVFVDVIHPDCSKGKALAWLMQREGLLADEVMAFGDNHNDLEMLRTAGHGFLMDNAGDDLKRLGFRPAPSNDADGVAKIIAEYFGA